MLLMLAALVAAIGLLAYLVWMRLDMHKSDVRIHEHPLPEGEERRGDYGLFLQLLEGLSTLDERYRTFTYRVMRAVAFIGVGCAIALAFEGKLTNDTARLTDDQASGRAVAIDALCGAVSGVVDAGRQTILGAALQPPTPFTRELEKLGYPPIKIRRKQAEAAARAYGSQIAAAVEKATHRKGLARKNGTLDCTRVKAAARASDPKPK